MCKQSLCFNTSKESNYILHVHVDKQKYHLSRNQFPLIYKVLEWKDMNTPGNNYIGNSQLLPNAGLIDQQPHEEKTHELIN